MERYVVVTGANRGSSLACCPALLGCDLVGPRAYGTSKLCNVLTTYETEWRSRRLGSDSPAINAFDPGFMPDTSRDPLLALGPLRALSARPNAATNA